MMKERLFFEFLQVAVGNRESMSAGINDADWNRLFVFCKRQALLGIGFTAVERLHNAGVVCPATLRMQWYGYVAQIERMNEKLNLQCRKLMERYEHDGFSCCILKGQSNQMVYPEGLKLRRTPGDIDLWTAPLPPCGGYCKQGNTDEGITIVVQTGKEDFKYVTCHGHRAVIEYVRMQYSLQGIDANPKACYHHIEAPSMDGTEVEVHYRPAFLRSPLRNCIMQRWFENHTDECMKNKTHLGFSMMTSSVNVVYQMCHLYTHVFEGGIGLRQLMDYYFALRVWHNDVMECKDLQSQGMWSEGLGTPVLSKEEVIAVIRSFGMAKFAGAVMFVLHEVFAMPTHYYICNPNEKEGKKLLAEIMQGGNFGQYDERGKELKNGGMMKHGLWKLKRVMRLVRSYPEEALWEPVFRVWHLGWRIIHN